MHSQRPHVDYKYSPHKGPMDVSTRCSVDVKKKEKKEEDAAWCYKQPLHWTKLDGQIFHIKDITPTSLCTVGMSFF